MESVLSTFQTFFEALSPRAAFLAVALIEAILMQVLVNNVFFKDSWLVRKPVWFFFWGSKLLGLLPILIGFILGVLWREPDVLIHTVPSGMAYFCAAGITGQWLFRAVKSMAQKKGIDLSIAGVETIAPPPNQPPKP